MTMKIILILIAAGCLMVALSGCATNRASTVYCEVTQPITWSKKDTPETIAQVKGQNAVYVALCS